MNALNSESGETDVSVPAAGDRDEIGEMARSLEVFRAGEIERRNFAERERAEQAAHQDRAAAVERMIAEFRATVTAVIATVTENVSRMEGTARTLATIAGEADQQGRTEGAKSHVACPRGSRAINRPIVPPMPATRALR